MFLESEELEFNKNKKSRNNKRIQNRRQKTQHIKTETNQPQKLHLKNIFPKTKNQKVAFDSWEADQNLVLHGTAGTGKTFIAFYLALNDIVNNGSNRKIVIVRSALPTRNLGYLPGSLKEKTEVYEAPYVNICKELTGHMTSYEFLKSKGLIQFESTSFLRGLTISNAVVIFDEFQSATLHEIGTVISRLGDNTRMILSGDGKQDDLIYSRNEASGFKDSLNILNHMSEFTSIEFDSDDIIRGGICRSWIKAREKLKL